LEIVILAVIVFLSTDNLQSDVIYKQNH